MAALSKKKVTSVLWDYVILTVGTILYCMARPFGMMNDVQAIQYRIVPTVRIT